LDSAYVSLINDQPVLDTAGLYVSGFSISGLKVVSGVWNFGYDPAAPGTPSNPTNIIANAPKSYTTNDKYNYAAGAPAPTVSQKFAALEDSDIVTKLVLEDQISNLEIDNGVYDSVTDPTCFNYSIGINNSTTVCPL
jgi:hypothetical protein